MYMPGSTKAGRQHKIDFDYSNFSQLRYLVYKALVSNAYVLYYAIFYALYVTNDLYFFVYLLYAVHMVIAYDCQEKNFGLSRIFIA